MVWNGDAEREAEGAARLGAPARSRGQNGAYARMQLAGTDIRLLRVFDAVVRHRGFAAAQAELNVSQSTISSQISALEDRLGVTLCRRGRAGFRLTQKGEAVHAAVVRLLAAMDGFVSETAGLRGNLTGTLRIGVVDSVVTDPDFRLPEAIAALEAQSPAIRFDLAQCSPQELQSRVLDGVLHLGIGSFPHKVKGLRYQHLYDETNYLYCARNHRLWAVEDAQLSPDFVASLRVVGRSYWREDHWNNRDFPNSTAMAQGLEQQLIMILSGAFIGYMPQHAAAPWVAQGRLRPILPDEFIYRCGFDAVTRSGVYLSPLTQALIAQIETAYAAAGAPVRPTQEDPGPEQAT